MISKLVERLTYRHNIASHLSQLSHLVNREVKAEDLLPLDATRAIMEQIKLTLKNKPSKKFQIRFSEKTAPQFTTFVECLHALNSGPIYIWLNHTNDCGLFEVRSIREIDFKFEFSKIPGEIISLITKDFSDEMLLDFFEESTGEKYIEIELTGDRWSSCTYG